MASYIKNQLAKKMAVFFKDMTPDRFSLSFFKGEGTLTNLGESTGEETLGQAVCSSALCTLGGAWR